MSRKRTLILKWGNLYLIETEWMFVPWDPDIFYFYDWTSPAKFKLISSGKKYAMYEKLE